MESVIARHLQPVTAPEYQNESKATQGTEFKDILLPRLWQAQRQHPDEGGNTDKAYLHSCAWQSTWGCVAGAATARLSRSTYGFLETPTTGRVDSCLPATPLSFHTGHAYTQYHTVLKTAYCSTGQKRRWSQCGAQHSGNVSRPMVGPMLGQYYWGRVTGHSLTLKSFSYTHLYHGLSLNSQLHRKASEKPIHINFYDSLGK